MEGGRKEEGILVGGRICAWWAGGFALDGREGSGHNEGGARENMRQR